jgi:hypothetical protein
LRALSLTLPLLLLLWGCQCGQKPTEPAPNPSPATEPALATLTQVQGQVSVLREAATRAGRENEPISTGETLVTGPASTARLRYVNGVEIQVSENSRFKVSGVPGKLSLELEEGHIISTAPKEGGGAGLTVRGRFGQAEIVTAAEMEFDLRSKEPRLALEYGEIVVLDPDGQQVPVVAGEEIEFSLGKPKPRQPQVVQGEEIVFTLRAQGGKARVKGAQQTTFTEVSPDQPIPLASGSAFEVPAQATARLSSSELQVSLSGDAAGTLTQASRQGDERAYALQLSKGKARLQFAPGKHRLKLTDGKGELELQVAEQSTISVSDPQSGSTVSVVTGQVELVADGKTTVVKAGEVVSRSVAEARPAAAKAPALVLPPDAKARIFADDIPEAGIRVPEATGGPLRVEVAGAPDFREPLLAGRVGAEWVRIDPPARGELHWRFLAEDGAVRTQGSARFQPDRGRSSLAEDSPRAEVLETGLKATVYFQSAAPSLHFSFSAREGARSYRVRIFRANDPQKPLLERRTDKPQYTLEPGALGEGKYLWYVAALGPGGDELAGGRMNKLDLVYDNARQGLAISRPKAGERPGKSGLPLEGVAPIGSRLFVNGEPVTLDAKGRFSQRVPPTNQLVFRLVSKQGEAYWVRTLRSAR